MIFYIAYNNVKLAIDRYHFLSHCVTIYETIELFLNRFRQTKNNALAFIKTMI